MYINANLKNKIMKLVFTFCTTIFGKQDSTMAAQSILTTPNFIFLFLCFLFPKLKIHPKSSIGGYEVHFKNMIM